MATDLGRIEEKNIEEWLWRIEFLKTMDLDVVREPYRITRPVLRRFIGLGTNVSNKTRKQFMARVVKILERRADEGIQADEPTGASRVVDTLRALRKERRAARVSETLTRSNQMTSKKDTSAAGWIADNPNSIRVVQLISVKHAIKLEALGMRHSCGKSVRLMWAKHLGMTGRPSAEAVIARIEELLAHISGQPDFRGIKRI